MKKGKVREKVASTIQSRSSGLVGKTFRVYADANTVKYQGHVNELVGHSDSQGAIYLVEVDDRLHLVPISSMVAGSLERGPGTWEFE